MRIAVILMMVCLSATGWNISGYCQEGEEIEQSESVMEERLDAEMGSEETDAEGEMVEVESSIESNDLSR